MGVARFSVEVRTADAVDAADGRGAQRGRRAPRVASGWFRRVDDGTPLPAPATER